MNLAPAELQTLLTAVRTELRQAVSETSSPYRDRNGAAAYLQCSVRSFDSDVAEGRVKPCGFYRGHPRFKVSDLDRLLTERRK